MLFLLCFSSRGKVIIKGVSNIIGIGYSITIIERQRETERQRERNKAKCISSVNHATKTIHHHHHQLPDVPGTHFIDLRRMKG